MAKQGNDRGPLVGLYRDDAERMGAVVKLVEGESKGGPSKRGYRRTYFPNGLVPAKTKSSGITAGTQTTPTSSTVTLLVPSGSGDGLTAGSDVAVLNYSTRAVTGAGKLTWVTHFNGKYVFPISEC